MTSRLARGESMRSAVYNLAAGGIRVATALAAIPCLLHALGPSAYGVWTLATAATGILAMAEAPLSATAVVFASRALTAPRALSRSITALLAITCILAGLCAVAALSPLPAIVAAWLARGDVETERALRGVLGLGAWVAAARLLQSALGGILQAEARFGMLNAITTTQAVVTTAVMVTLALMGADVRDLVKVQLAGTFGAAIISAAWVVPLLRRRAARLAVCRATLGEVAHHLVLSGAASLGTVLFTYLDRLVVGTILGVRAGGTYGAIAGLAAQINVVSALPAQPVTALVARAWASGSDEKVQARARLGFAFELQSAVAFGLGILVVSFADPIARALFGGATAEATWGIRAAGAVYALYSPNALGFYALFGLDALRRSAAITATVGCASLVLVAAGASRLGVVGAIGGNAGYLGVWLLTVVAMRRLGIPVRTWWRWLSPYLAWFVVTGVLACGMPPGWVAPTAFTAVAHVALFLLFYRRHRAVIAPWLRWMRAR